MITIVLATYNGARYIKEQLDSIAAQTFKDWHLAVSDDGSTDGTAEIIEAFAADHKGKVTILQKDRPTGSARSNFFYLLNNVDDDYIMFSDQDDVWNEDKVQITYDAMKKLETDKKVPCLVCTDVAVVDGKLNTIDPSFFHYQRIVPHDDILKAAVQNCIIGCAMMINRPLKKIMALGTELEDIKMHDDWAALCAAAYGKTSVLNVSTMKYRQHDDNSVGAQSATDPAYLIRRLKEGSRSYRKILKSRQRQAGYFIKATAPVRDGALKDEVSPLTMPSKTLDILTEYAELDKRSKLKRVSFYIRHKMIKNGITRVIPQLLWG